MLFTANQYARWGVDLLLYLRLSPSIDMHLITGTVRHMTTGLPFDFERLHHVQLAIPAGGERNFSPARKAQPAILITNLAALADHL